MKNQHLLLPEHEEQLDRITAPSVVSADFASNDVVVRKLYFQLPLLPTVDGWEAELFDIIISQYRLRRMSFSWCKRDGSL